MNDISIVNSRILTHFDLGEVCKMMYIDYQFRSEITCKNPPRSLELLNMCEKLNLYRA